jgi:hypothetical protein
MSSRHYIINALENFSECEQSPAKDKAICLLDRMDEIDLTFIEGKQEVLDVVDDLLKTDDCTYCPQLDGMDYDLRKMWMSDSQSLL